jgi:hypothetical protein
VRPFFVHVAGVAEICLFHAPCCSHCEVGRHNGRPCCHPGRPRGAAMDVRHLRGHPAARAPGRTGELRGGWHRQRERQGGGARTRGGTGALRGGEHHTSTSTHTHTQRERREKGKVLSVPPRPTSPAVYAWEGEGGGWRVVCGGGYAGAVSACMHGLGHGTWTRAQLDVVALHSYAGAEALGRLVGGYLATLRRAATADPEKERKTRLLVQEWGVSAPNATAQAAMFAAKAAQIAKHGVPSMYWALRPAADVRPSSRPFWRPLTEIYLCDVCSCHSEILRRNGRAGPRLIDAL